MARLHAYGMILDGHRLTDTESVDFEISPVDFCLMAEAAGVNAQKIILGISIICLPAP
ncbi:MAG: hypothetical protein PVJ50_00890 [Desulfobacterales bacterium]|jgi:hypothetical protein